MSDLSYHIWELLLACAHQSLKAKTPSGGKCDDLQPNYLTNYLTYQAPSMAPTF